MKTMLKYLSNVFSENKYLLVQIPASTGRGDFNNSTNVTQTQIQLIMMTLLIYSLIPGVIRKMKYIGHVDD